MLRRFLVCALATALTAGAAAAQEGGGDAARTERPKKQEPPKPVKADPNNPTPEQIAETVVLVYGSREGLQQIRRTGVERGKITRTASDGRPEEITYERAFKRGDTSDKDKVRLDQRMSSLEYSLVFSDGRVTGLLRGTPFTPKQEDVSQILSERAHGIDALLRYKENGGTLKYNGKESQKGLDLWVLEMTDKGGRATRYYVSSKTARILWLEYDEAAAGGGAPVKYRRTFHNYRLVQGTLVPYRSVLYEGDRQVEEQNVMTVTYGVRMEDSRFAAQAASFAP
ncbi:MAG TPA: hypothetical protein VF668_06520 [Pyrinomonadaceae bacterium]